MRPHNKKPCRECPFRRISINGYTGNASPEELLGATMTDQPMPCHMSIDYTDEYWLTKWYDGEIGRFCAGALIFFSNIFKVSRDRERPRLPANREIVFAHPKEFLDHHTKSIEDVIREIKAKKAAKTPYQQKEEHGSRPKKARRAAKST